MLKNYQMYFNKYMNKINFKYFKTGFLQIQFLRIN